METDKAVLAFSQSEKIKAGLIWAGQALEILRGLKDGEIAGGQKMVGAWLAMITHETRLARATVPDEQWDAIDPHIERAIVMVNSGVGHEAGIHLTRALSKTTNIAERSMSFLKEEGIL